MDKEVESKKLMIIDTDCGIDDAMALLLALSYGDEWELLAITCCYGNTSVDNVCQNVLRVLVLTERTQIPVFKGCTRPLVHNYSATSLVHGEDGFGNVAHHFTTGNLTVSEEHAAQALVRLVNQHPQRITLAVLGPLTNIALALRIDPQFTHKLESLVFLGGNYKGIGNMTSSAEFNFHCDPEAANIVVTEAACPVTMVPWETTMEHGMDRKYKATSTYLIMAKSSATAKKLMIVDTDCGIDDAEALLLALSYSSEWMVVAVTCCFGNTSVDNACSNVMRVLHLTNFTQIPIYRGSSQALVHQNPLGTAHGDDGFGNVSAQFPTGGLSVAEGHAVNVLVKLAKENPKKITLVALGPLTNLAMAHRMDPEFTQNLKAIMLMGGSLEGTGNITASAEFNFHSDPEAANIILTEASCPISMVPMETGKRHGMEREWYEKWIKTKTKRGNMMKCITAFRSNRALQLGIPVILDYDLLAMAALLCPKAVLKSCGCPVSVELCARDTRGQAIIGKTENSKGENKELKRIIIITGFDDTLLNMLREKMIEN